MIDLLTPQFHLGQQAQLPISRPLPEVPGASYPSPAVRQLILKLLHHLADARLGSPCPIRSRPVEDSPQPTAQNIRLITALLPFLLQRRRPCVRSAELIRGGLQLCRSLCNLFFRSSADDCGVEVLDHIVDVLDSGDAGERLLQVGHERADLRLFGSRQDPRWLVDAVQDALQLRDGAHRGLEELGVPLEEALNRPRCDSYPIARRHQSRNAQTNTHTNSAGADAGENTGHGQRLHDSKEASRDYIPDASLPRGRNGA